ncbi:MAG: site-specific integrase [Dehalococcoidia bacterium]|nr:site-specific integrase [Dehalococcoidia bacterium]
MTPTELRELLRGLVNEGMGFPDGLTVKDVEDKFLRGKGGKLARSTRVQYEWMFGKLAERGALWPRNAGDVNEFLGVSRDALGDRSVLQLFKCLRAVSGYCSRTYGWADVMENVERPRVLHKRRRYFDEVELAAVIGACRDEREKVLILVLLDSSARIGEVARLRTSDLGKDYFVVVGKTGERRYRCDERLVSMMRRISCKGVVFPKKVCGSCDRYVKPIQPSRSDGLSSQVKRIMERAGLKGEKLGPHTLRHTAASIVARETGSVLAVRALLQHDSVKTSEMYIHDADSVVQQRVSPLRLCGVKVKELEGLPGLGVVDGAVVSVDEESEGKREFVCRVEELLPHAPEGVVIRPGLSTEDLELIRSGLVALMVQNGESGSGVKSVQLMRRMLRRRV